MRCSVSLVLSCLLSASVPACHFDTGGSGGFFGDDELPWDDDPVGQPGDPSDGGDDPRSCFYGDGDADTPAAVIEHTLTAIEGIDVVHVQLVLDPRFVDNTYGATAVGWQESKKGTHTFDQLVGSDRAELLLYDADGALALDVSLDYLSADDASPSGYRSLGVLGGDGDVLAGDAAHVVAATSSLARNLNERGHASFTSDSPATDAGYAPNPAAPDWDFRVVYEVWIALEAFGSAGFGEASIDYIHASPAKGGENTIVVDPGPCPTDWCVDAYDCTPGCNDPDGCDPGEPGDPGDPDGCTEDSDCPTGEFCGEEGTCLPIVG